MRQVDGKGNEHETQFKRVYYETSHMGTDHFRGSASVEVLRSLLSSSQGDVLVIRFDGEGADQVVSISSRLNILLRGEYLPSRTTRTLQPGRMYNLQIDHLHFEIEVLRTPSQS